MYIYSTGILPCDCLKKEINEIKDYKEIKEIKFNCVILPVHRNFSEGGRSTEAQRRCVSKDIILNS